jgi:putative spermidine/putrescine transport system substrate-binding protein
METASMTGPSDYARDLIALAQERAEASPITRRGLLALAGATGAAVGIGGMNSAFGQAREMLLINWGGDAIGAMGKAWAEPFMKANPGMAVKLDGAGPSSGKIKAMVESGKVTWDVCDRNLPASVELGRLGLLEEIDYSIVDKAKIRAEHAGKWGVGSYLYSNVLTWDTRAFGGRKPETWADFWNIKDFPGKRTLRRTIDGQLEAALLADGVPPEKIYPIDMKRALDKIKQIKQHTVFWNSAADSQALLRDREVTMGGLFNTRAIVTRRDTNGAIDFTYNQGSVWVGAWIVPKGAPAGKDVMRFIASTQDPAGQIELFKILGNSPVNPAAAAQVPADMKALDAGSAENYAKQIPADAEWYAANAATAVQQYLDAIS